MIADQDTICLPQEQFEALLECSAERGANKALDRIGLGGKEAAGDIRDLRDLIAAVRSARSTIFQTIVRSMTMAAVAIMLMGFLYWRTGE
jgi:hypothetical protein